MTLFFAAISITVLLGFVGFSVDLGNWYLSIEHEQRAADAAALSGVAYLPEDPTKAISDARSVLVENGLSASEAGSANIVTSSPTELDVSVTSAVNNSFISLLGGAKTQRFSRHAAAQHDPTAAVSDPGSGTNLLGNEPPNDNNSWEEPSLEALHSNFWVDAVGGTTEDFPIHVPSTVITGLDDFEVYDAGFADTASDCSAGCWRPFRPSTPAGTLRDPENSVVATITLRRGRCPTQRLRYAVVQPRADR